VSGVIVVRVVIKIGKAVLVQIAEMLATAALVWAIRQAVTRWRTSVTVVHLRRGTDQKR
jgi:hypothetical protein